MSWQTLIILNILVANILHPILFKKSADLPYKTKQQFWIYSFCVILAIGFWGYKKQFILSSATLIVFSLGFIISLAFYWQLRATNISQSKSAIFSIGHRVLTILLAWVFLNELKYFDSFFYSNLGQGVILTFLSAALFIFNSRQELKKIKKLFAYLAGFGIISAIASLFARFYALNGIPFSNFGLAWYSGAWLGAVLLLQLTTNKEEKSHKMSKWEIINALGVAFFVWLALLLSYSALKIVFITVFQPFLLISGMLFPVLIGLLIFKEIKKITLLEIIAFLIGITGGVIIIFGL